MEKNISIHSSWAFKRGEMLTFKIDLWFDCHSRKCIGEAGARNKCAVVFLLLSCSYNIEIDYFGGKYSNYGEFVRYNRVIIFFWFLVMCMYQRWS